MIELLQLPSAKLNEMNLHVAQGQLNIDWPSDVNLYHMTLGKYLGAADRDRIAILYEDPDGVVTTQSFAQVDVAATNLAASLRALGYGRGDLIGLHTGQHPDTAVAHMAICKIGGTAVTLSQLYGPETLQHAINDCQLNVLLTGSDAWSSLRAEASTLFPTVQHVLVRNPEAGEFDLQQALSQSAVDFTPDYTGADEPALLMYTSGSTGKPKGILHGHRILAAYTPSINLFFNLSMSDDDAVYWSPSDWAWVGGLLDMLFPAWMAGRTIATSLERFTSDYAYNFMQQHKVTHTFLAPTAIKRLAQHKTPRQDFTLSLRVICTGGEALAADTLSWAENSLNVVCNEFYGMTEVNHLIGNCDALFPRKPGSMGRAYPGHQVYLVDSNGQQVANGEPGEIVTIAESPTRFLGYLNNSEKEAEMQLGPYLRTNDLAVCDSDGYFWYKGRTDDLIKSSGFRIGPAEIEECLLSHDSVAEVAVVGKPDEQRGSIIKAFIKLRVGYTPGNALIDELKLLVHSRLAGYKAPREIEFVSDFSMTSSGKINRRILRETELEKSTILTNR